jgi:hypothetical protein
MMLKHVNLQALDITDSTRVCYICFGLVTIDLIYIGVFFFKHPAKFMGKV